MKKKIIISSILLKVKVGKNPKKNSTYFNHFIYFYIRIFVRNILQHKEIILSKKEKPPQLLQTYEEKTCESE